MCQRVRGFYVYSGSKTHISVSPLTPLTLVILNYCYLTCATIVYRLLPLLNIGNNTNGYLRPPLLDCK